MKIYPNFDNSHQNFNNKQSFKAKLLIMPNEGNCDRLVREFEKITPTIDGVVGLVKNNDFYDIFYSNKKTFLSCKTNIDENIFKTDHVYYPKEPFKKAITQIIANLDDMMAKTGVGYGENNPFSKVFDNLSKK